MSKSNRYKNKPCGYCGKRTGKNHGEHVLPDCLYPSNTPATLQRLKISACPACNAGFSQHENHFKAIILSAGLNPSAGRMELWEDVRDAFDKPIHGDPARLAVASTLVPTGLVYPSGNPICKIYPFKDPRVSFIVRKVVRGLAHHKMGLTVPDNHVGVTKPVEGIELANLPYTLAYEVPGVFAGAFFNMSNFVHVKSPIKAIWQIKFFEVPFTAFVSDKPMRDIEDVDFSPIDVPPKSPLP